MFPPDPTKKVGFYDLSVYEEALKRYPSIPKLIKEKAKENGNKIWLTFEDKRTFTYKDVDIISDSIAQNLLKIGMKKNDKAAIFAYNSPEWIFSYFGILKGGGIPVTVNTSFIKDPLIYNLDMTDSKFLFLDERLLKSYLDVKDALSKIETIILIGNYEKVDGLNLNKNIIKFSELTSKVDEELELPSIKGKDPSAMILTSGTTGRSKIVVESNAQFIATALDMIDAGGVTPDSTVYVFLPLFHIMALDLATISSMLANASMVLVEKFNPAQFWKDIKLFKITHFHAVGPIFEILIKQEPNIYERDHDTIVAIAYSSKEIWEIATKRFNIKITGGYGGTEAGIPVTSPYDIVIKGLNPPGSCGKPTPPYEVQIVNEEGFPVGKNEAGEIIIRSKLPYVTFLEYYNMPVETVNAFKGLWFHTGDIGKYDENGYIYFVDRAKDAIRRRGENISSFEIEQILLKNEKIMEVAVYPVPSKLGEDEVMAAIVKRHQELTPEEIIDFSLDNMPRFWVPNYIRFMPSLPRTPTGRIEKYKLKAQGITDDTFLMEDYIKKKIRELKK